MLLFFIIFFVRKKVKLTRWNDFFVRKKVKLTRWNEWLTKKIILQFYILAKVIIFLKVFQHDFLTVWISSILFWGDLAPSRWTSVILIENTLRASKALVRNDTIIHFNVVQTATLMRMPQMSKLFETVSSSSSPALLVQKLWFFTAG